MPEPSAKVVAAWITWATRLLLMSPVPNLWAGGTKCRLCGAPWVKDHDCVGPFIPPEDHPDAQDPTPDTGAHR
jgi:hypothetical protein